MNDEQRTGDPARTLSSSGNRDTICIIVGKRRRKFFVEKSRFSATSKFLNIARAKVIHDVSLPCYIFPPYFSNNESLFEIYEEWLRGDENFFLQAVVTVSQPSLTLAYDSERIPALWMLGERLRDKTFQNRVVDSLVDWVEAKWEMHFRTLEKVIQLMVQKQWRPMERLAKWNEKEAFLCPLVRCAITLYVMVARNGTKKLQYAKQRLSAAARRELERARVRITREGRKLGQKKTGLRLQKDDFHV